MTNRFYIFFCFVAATSTIFLHELAHWVVGEILGYEMVMTLNSCWPAKGFYDTNWHYTFISAVGPIFTLFQAILFYLLFKRTTNLYFYPFLFAPFFMELFSTLMNFRRLNDLGRIGETLGIGVFTLPTVFVGFYVALLLNVAKKNKFGWRFNSTTFFWVAIFAFVWIGINQIKKVHLIN